MVDYKMVCFSVKWNKKRKTRIMSDKEVLEQLGKRIANRRKECGLTQEQLAEKIGLSLQSVSCIELGKKGVRPDNLVKICQSLNVSADYLLLGKRDNSQTNQLTEKIAKLSPCDYDMVEALVNRLS